MTKNNEGGVDLPPALTISGTIYGEDKAIDMLRDAGYTEQTSDILRGLVERRKITIGPDARITAGGTVLKLVKDKPIEGEVVDDKDDKKED